MWFKNLHIYDFVDEFDFNIEQLETNLQHMHFKPCASILPMSSGWKAPIGDDEESPLIHSANGLMLICLRIEEKLLPATVIRDHLHEKVIKLQADQGRKISSKEKLALKDEIYSTLLPRAFSKNTEILAIIDPENQRLIIDVSSRTKAEDFINFLRKTLGSLPVALVETVSPGRLMTKWLKEQQTPRNFSIAESCMLVDSKLEGSTVRCSKQDLLTPNIQAFLADGMVVSQIQLQWKEHLQLTLKDDFSVSGIKYTDAVQDLAADIHTENKEQQLDASFFIMSQTLQEFLVDLLEVFQKSEKAED
jgi:recombination associated protein RdgC